MVIIKHILNRVFLLCVPMLFVFSLQSHAHCGMLEDTPEVCNEPYVYAENNGKYVSSNSLKILGCFASSEEPDNGTIHYEHTFTTQDDVYVGIIVKNNGSTTVEVVKTKFIYDGKLENKEGNVHYKMSYKYKTDIAANEIKMLYDQFNFSKPGRYSFKIKTDFSKKYEKIRIKVTDDTKSTSTSTRTPENTPTLMPTP